MKRAALHANKTYVLRRANDRTAPARLLDAANLWTPLSDDSGLFRVSSVTAAPMIARSGQRVGLLVASLVLPGPDQSTILSSPQILDRFAGRMNALPDLPPTRRSPEGLADWLEEVGRHHGILPLRLEVVPNVRLLASWGTPLVSCPECGREGFSVDGEGRLPVHDSRPSLRALCRLSRQAVPVEVI